ASVIVCRPVAHSLGADLQQQGCTIVRVLLHDAIAIAGDPNIVLIIDEAPVDAIWQDIRVPPRVYYVTVGIVFDHRWGRDRNDSLGCDQTVLESAVDREDVIS